MHAYRMLIAGEWCAAASGASFESLNPFTGKAWASVPRGGIDDVDRAVTAARTAFENPSWRGLNATQRGALLYRLGDLVAEHAAELERLVPTSDPEYAVEGRIWCPGPAPA